MSDEQLVEQAAASRGAQWHSGATLATLALLALIAIAVFGPAILFPPIGEGGDDLVLLSTVARAPTPAPFFAGDWGLGNFAYRPLHSLTLWGTYRLFGIDARYSQLLNLAIHLIAISLLYSIIHTVQRDRTLAFLFTTMSLGSMYTYSPATWVSDRPTLFVAVFLLGLLRVMAVSHRSHPNAPPFRTCALLVLLSMLALMSKESGLVLPLFAALWALIGNVEVPMRRRVVGTALALILGYSVFRLIVFRTYAAEYQDASYLLGVVRYDSLASIPTHFWVLALFENLVGNVVAAFVPIFNNDGAFLTWRKLIQISPIWAPTIVLTVMGARRPLSPIQKVGLIIVASNAAVHWMVFAYRTMYLSALGVSLFLAGSNLLDGKRGRRALVRGLATVSVVSSLWWVHRTVNIELARRWEELTPSGLKAIAAECGNIDDAILEQVRNHYLGP